MINSSSGRELCSQVGVATPAPGLNRGQPDASNISGIVLAAGAGVRYGMPKVLAHRGEWLRLAVDALARGGCRDVVVVLGAAVVEVPSRARAVVARDWARGMSASLRAGLLATAKADLVVVRLVDTPDVGPDAVRRVAAAAAGTGLARATYDGRPGHPVAVARRHCEALMDALHGDEGARRFLAGRSDVVDVECWDLASGADLDEVQPPSSSETSSCEAGHPSLRDC